MPSSLPPDGCVGHPNPAAMPPTLQGSARLGRLQCVLCVWGGVAVWFFRRGRHAQDFPPLCAPPPVGCLWHRALVTSCSHKHGLYAKQVNPQPPAHLACTAAAPIAGSTKAERSSAHMGRGKARTTTERAGAAPASEALLPLPAIAAFAARMSCGWGGCVEGVWGACSTASAAQRGESQGPQVAEVCVRSSSCPALWAPLLFLAVPIIARINFSVLILFQPLPPTTPGA